MRFLIGLLASCLFAQTSPYPFVPQQSGGGGGPAFVNAESGIGSALLGVFSISALNVTSGNLLFAVTANNVNGGTCSAPGLLADTAGNTFTPIGSVNGANGSFACTQLYYAAGVTGNSSDVLTVTYIGGGSQVEGIAVVQVSGATTKDAGPASAAAVTGATPASASYTTTTASEILLAAIADYYNTDTVTAGSGYTIPANGAYNFSLAGLGWIGIEYKIVSTTQSGITSAFAVSGSGYSNIGVGTFH